MDLTGKSVDDILNASMENIVSLKDKDLRAVASRLVSASNKRLRRLANDKTKWGKLSPVYQKKQFSIRGKTRNQVLREFKKMKGFMKAETSTLRGFKKYRDMVYTKVGFIPKKNVKKFWKIYRKFADSHRGWLYAINGGEESGSLRMQKYLRFLYITMKVTKEDELLSKMEEKMNAYYEEMA